MNYRELFVHRDDVFALQHESGNYEPVRRPLEDEDIDEHLAGFVSYGVYVIEPKLRPHIANNQGELSVQGVGNTVKFAVFDLDTYDAAALEFLCGEVQQLVAAAHSTRHPLSLLTPWECLLLEDSGGKGYHIWLLLSEPVSAAKVRAWTEPIRSAYDRANPGSWPALEIFPKQDEVPEGGYGNLVKLPLGRHAKSGAQSYFKLRTGWATGIDRVRPFPAELVPERVHPVRTRESDDESHGMTAFACVNELLENGAGSGCRDKAMYWLARFWRSSGLTQDQVETCCLDANERFDPPMGHGQVLKCVRSAFGAAFSRPKCGEDWHGTFCPGSDRMRSCPNFNGSGDAATRSRDDEDEAWSLTPEERIRRLREEGNN